MDQFVPPLFAIPRELAVELTKMGGLLDACDDAKKLGRPKGFRVTVREARLSAGAGFVVAMLGDVMTMPGLPKVPSAVKIDLDEKGNVVGLF